MNIILENLVCTNIIETNVNSYGKRLSTIVFTDFNNKKSYVWITFKDDISFKYNETYNIKCNCISEKSSNKITHVRVLSEKTAKPNALDVLLGQADYIPHYL